MVFTKRDLEEKLGFTREERKLIMDFQKKLPMLEKEGDNSKVNAKDLHTQLQVGRDFTTWIKGRINRYGFKENEDYILTLTKTGERKNVVQHEYNLTLDMAKELCMIENSELGQLARKYFILMEKAVKYMVEWNLIRTPEKELYKTMCHELDLYLQRNFNKRPQFYDYSNEADSLNLICLGAKAKDILNYFEAQDKITRDHLTKEYNEYLLKMQELNIMYLRMNMEKQVRYNLIQQGFKALYPNASFVIANKTNRPKDIIA